MVGQLRRSEFDRIATSGFDDDDRHSSLFLLRYLVYLYLMLSYSCRIYTALLAWPSMSNFCTVLLLWPLAFWRLRVYEHVTRQLKRVLENLLVCFVVLFIAFLCAEFQPVSVLHVGLVRISAQSVEIYIFIRIKILKQHIENLRSMFYV